MSLETPTLVDRVLYPRALANNIVPRLDEFDKWSDRQKLLYLFAKAIKLGSYVSESSIRLTLSNLKDFIIADYKDLLYLRERSCPFNNSSEKDSTFSHLERIKKHFMRDLWAAYERTLLGFFHLPLGINDLIFDVNSKHGVYGFRVLYEPDPSNNRDSIKVVVMEEVTFRQYCAMAYKEGREHFGQCATGECVDTLDPISFFEPLYKDYEGMQSTKYLTSRILAKLGLCKISYDYFMTVLKMNFQAGRDGDPGPFFGLTGKVGNTDKSL